MTSLPPMLWLSLLMLFPGLAAKAPTGVGTRPSIHRQVEAVPVFTVLETEYPPVPDSLVFDEVKETESEDDEAPRGLGDAWMTSLRSIRPPFDLRASSGLFLPHTPSTEGRSQLLRC